MRTFRQTLLCRSAHVLPATPQVERLESLAVSANAQAGTADEDGRVTFTGANGSNLTTDHAEPAGSGTAAAARPRVTTMARLQAAEGPLVADLRHEPTTLDDPARLLVTLLDGTRDRAALVAVLAESFGVSVAQSELPGWVEASLAELARSALPLPS